MLSVRVELFNHSVDLVPRDTLNLSDADDNLVLKYVAAEPIRIRCYAIAETRIGKIYGVGSNPRELLRDMRLLYG